MMKFTFLSLLFISVNFSAFSQFYANLDMYCSDIKRETNTSLTEISFSTPIDEAIYFKKLINDLNIRYIMTVSVIGPVDKTGKGVTISLSRNNSIKKPDAITKVYKNEKGQFVHYASFTLTKDDITKLQRYLIKNYTVFMYSGGQASNNVKFQGYMYCLEKL